MEVGQRRNAARLTSATVRAEREPLGSAIIETLSTVIQGGPAKKPDSEQLAASSSSALTPYAMV